MSEPLSHTRLRVLPQPDPNPWIVRYQQEELAGKNEQTLDAYLRILRQIATFVSQLPGSNGQFHPSYLTRTAFSAYIDELREQEYSTSHLERVKAVVNRFCLWLIAEGEMRGNPTRGVTIPAQALLAPRELSKEQRFVLRNLDERTNDLRGKAIFALGYWAGCRVSDVSYLQMAHTEVGPKVGKLYVGHKQGKYRHIVLLNQARGPLYDYLRSGRRTQESAYVFTSQRETLPVPEGELDGWRLSEAAIHEWFKQTPSVQLPFWNRQRFTLRGKHIGALLCTPSGAQIVVERPACLIQEHNMAIFSLFVADIELADLWPHLGVRHLEVRDIADATPGPVPQRKDGLPTQIVRPLIQIAQHEALLF